MCGENRRNDADSCIQRVLLLPKPFGATSLVRCSLALGSDLGGGHWMSQHLVASLNHCESSWCTTFPLLKFSL